MNFKQYINEGKMSDISLKLGEIFAGDKRFKRLKKEGDADKLYGYVRSSSAVQALAKDLNMKITSAAFQELISGWADSLNETPVGIVGRTGQKDAEYHCTPEKVKEFNKLVKQIGGKTVAKHLLTLLDQAPYKEPEVNDDASAGVPENTLKAD